MVDRYRIWPEGFAAHMRPAKPVDMVFADEHDAEIADIKAENERLAEELAGASSREEALKAEIDEQRERLIQFANAFDAGYAAAERALAERAGGVKVKALLDAIYTDPHYVGGGFPQRDDEGLLYPGSPYDRGRYDARKVVKQHFYALPKEPAAPEGQQEPVAWQHIPGCGTDRESKMVFVSEGVFCDPCIAPLVAALNAAGIETVASCCGHDHRPGSIALRDGRCLVIARDLDEWRKIDATFPTDINGDTRPSEQAVTEAMVKAAAKSLRPDLFTPIKADVLQSDDYALTCRRNAKIDVMGKARAALKAAMEAGR